MTDREREVVRRELVSMIQKANDEVLRILYILAARLIG